MCNYTFFITDLHSLNTMEIYYIIEHPSSESALLFLSHHHHKPICISTSKQNEFGRESERAFLKAAAAMQINREKNSNAITSRERKRKGRRRRRGWRPRLPGRHSSEKCVCFWSFITSSTSRMQTRILATLNLVAAFLPLPSFLADRTAKPSFVIVLPSTVA